ncbi:MAG TPA: putative zinc-binding protein [Thermoanaerobaculia bacterium]
MAMEMKPERFSLNVQKVKGLCPAGEAYAKEQIAAGTIPVLSCEGACIRGEIARLAGNLVAQEMPSLARACHAETFFVPDSAMAEWVRSAETVVMIDGCFLKCHGRVLQDLIRAEKILHIDALPLYRKYTDVFLMDDVPEEERKAVAREVAAKIKAELNERREIAGATTATACACQ